MTWSRQYQVKKLYEPVLWPRPPRDIYWGPEFYLPDAVSVWLAVLALVALFFWVLRSAAA